MALTKVRLPVAALSAISNGTSSITVLTAGGDMEVDIAGVTTMNLRSTDITILSTVPLVAPLITTEDISLTTVAGADMTVQTTATQGEIETTTAHPLVLGANSIDALTIATDGKVALAVDGTAANHLVDKGYVDTAVATAAALSDIVATNTSNGSISIPNSSGNDIIINWGTTASVNSGSGAVAVTFDTAFPNAFLVAVVSRNIASNGADEGVNYAGGSTTGMNVYPTYSASSPVGWVAIGY